MFKGCGAKTAATNCDDASGTGSGTCACAADLCNDAAAGGASAVAIVAALCLSVTVCAFA